MDATFLLLRCSGPATDAALVPTGGPLMQRGCVSFTEPALYIRWH